MEEPEAEMDPERANSMRGTRTEEEDQEAGPEPVRVLASVARALSKGHRLRLESGSIETSMDTTDVERDDLSADQTSTASTDMSYVENHSVALKRTGRMGAEHEGTKITGYRLMTLRRFLKSHLRGDIKWLRPRR